MKRLTINQVIVPPNLRALKVYPLEDTAKTIADLKTVGIKLSKDQAIALARVLLVASQDWDEMEITCYRKDKRSLDNTYSITVTTHA